MAKILLGLDIGTQTTKAVQLLKDKNKVNLFAAGFIATPVNGLSSTNINDEQAVGDSINRLVHEMKISTTEVSISLPSSKVITRVIYVPLMNEKELASSIQWEAEQYIPWQLSKMKLDYAIIDTDVNAKKMKVLLVAAPIELIEKYMRISQFAGLQTVAIETEILAMARCACVSYPNLSNMLLVTIGATTTEIAIVHNQILIYTKTYPVGGNTFTRAIVEDLGFDPNQAEEFKKTYGLEEDKLEGKLVKIIDPYFQNMLSEIEKNVTFFKEQYPQEELSIIILSGGTSRMPGLVLNLTKRLGIDSQIINPFMNINVDPKVLPIITPDAVLYTTAVGLALKDI
jgi:type IV pilus assembly protein PilM